MTIKLDIPAETEARLREQSQRSGKPIENFVREAIEEKLAGETKSARDLTSEERIELLRQWVAGHPKREGIHLDDSRESIYAGRGE